MSTPSYKGPSQPIRSAQGGIADFLGGLFGGTAPSYKTSTTDEPPAPIAPAPPAVPTPAPTLVPVCVACPFAGIPAGQLERDASCAAPVGDGTDAVIPVGPGPITIVIQPRS